MLFLTFFVHLYIFCGVACTIEMTDQSLSEPIDLDFNNDIQDSCDYHDYSNEPIVDNVPNFSGLSILQHNICGALGKQHLLKILLNDIKRECRVQVIMLAET